MKCKIAKAPLSLWGTDSRISAGRPEAFARRVIQLSNEVSFGLMAGSLELGFKIDIRQDGNRSHSKPISGNPSNINMQTPVYTTCKLPCVPQHADVVTDVSCDIPSLQASFLLDAPLRKQSKPRVPRSTRPQPQS